MKHEGFTHIGQTAATARPASPSVAGSNVGRGGAVASQADTQRVAAWLGAQRPADMDAAAVSRASQHGVGLMVRYEHRFPTGPNGEILPSYAVAVGCELDGDQTGVSAALADLRNFLTPAPTREIEAWLAELSVIVAKRQDDEFTEELRLSAYASRLAQYPADVVRNVLLTQTYKFWPSWDELEKRLKAIASPRRHMIAALERGMAPTEPSRRPPTEDERRRIQDLVDQMFPGRSSEMRRAAVDEALRGDCMTGATGEQGGAA